MANLFLGESDDSLGDDGRRPMDGVPGEDGNEFRTEREECGESLIGDGGGGGGNEDKEGEQEGSLLPTS